jgi:hypothetical protein
MRSRRVESKRNEGHAFAKVMEIILRKEFGWSVKGWGRLERTSFSMSILYDTPPSRNGRDR